MERDEFRRKGRLFFKVAIERPSSRREYVLGLLNAVAEAAKRYTDGLNMNAETHAMVDEAYNGIDFDLVAHAQEPALPRAFKIPSGLGDIMDLDPDNDLKHDEIIHYLVAAKEACARLTKAGVVSADIQRYLRKIETIFAVVSQTNDASLSLTLK